MPLSWHLLWINIGPFVEFSKELINTANVVGVITIFVVSTTKCHQEMLLIIVSHWDTARIKLTGNQSMQREWLFETQSRDLLWLCMLLSWQNPVSSLKRRLLKKSSWSVMMLQLIQKVCSHLKGKTALPVTLEEITLWRLALTYTM